VSAELVLLPRDEPDLSQAVAADRRPRDAMSTALRWIGLLGLFVFTLEMTCRIEDWIRFRTPILSPIASQVGLLVRDQDGIHGRPNARFQKWMLNALGTRGPEASLKKAPGTVRIVVVGASETFGLYESSGREFPRQLEDTLNRRLATRQCRAPRPSRFEVLNAAVPGMSLPTIEQDVRNRVRRFGADVIVLYPTPAQYLDDDPPRAARPDSSAAAGELSPLQAARPRIVTRVRNQVKAILPEVVKTWMRRRETAAYVRSRPAEWRFAAVPADRLAQYRGDLRTLIGTIRSTGAVPVLSTHANAFMQRGFSDKHLLWAWERFYPRATGSVIVAFDSVARPVTLGVASDSGVLAVDVAQRLSERTGAMFSDFSHFTDYGAGLVAGALAPALLAASGARDVCAGE
jgi:hypothetical protein